MISLFSESSEFLVFVLSIVVPEFTGSFSLFKVLLITEFTSLFAASLSIRG